MRSLERLLLFLERKRSPFFVPLLFLTQLVGTPLFFVRDRWSTITGKKSARKKMCWELRNELLKYDTNAVGFSFNNAYFCADLCELAYKSQPEIERVLPKLGYHGTDVLFFKTPLVAGFIIQWGDIIAVAFKGSTTWREWLNNFNIRLHRISSYGRVHAGFWHSLKKAGPVLCGFVLPRLAFGSKLVVTGHSRGGALAMLFAGMVWINGYRAHGVYTFGSPRFCDKELAAWYNGEPPAHPNET
jgi:hypothetical protein